MKIRNGFVSNSSSASYIAGICLLTEVMVESLPDNIKQQAMSVYDVITIPNSNLDLKFKISASTITLSVDNSNFDLSVELPLSEAENMFVLGLCSSGSDPDEDEDYCDVCEDWFDEEDQKLADAIRGFGGNVDMWAGHDG